jgi:uncharacterized membrane protein
VPADRAAPRGLARLRGLFLTGLFLVLPLMIDEGVKLIVSGGLVAPGSPERDRVSSGAPDGAR